MKFPTPIPVQAIAKRFNAQLIGDASLKATGINEIHKVEKGDIVFADVKKYFAKCIHSNASIIILNQKAECPEGKALLIVDHPFRVYDQLVREHRPLRPLSSRINESATIGKNTIIEANAVIGPDVSIGDNCHIQANVVIGEYTTIGNNVVIQAGTIIGTDAFYFKKENKSYHKFRSGGRVIIEDCVDIGALCTINRGVSGKTIIGEGSKLDCQVHIGHGVVLGKNCLIAAQVGIAGKTIVGNNVVIYGQAGIAQNLLIEDDVIIYAQSGISKNLEKGKIYFGYPAGEIHSKYKELAALRRLPEFFKKWKP